MQKRTRKPPKGFKPMQKENRKRKETSAKIEIGKMKLYENIKENK